MEKGDPNYLTLDSVMVPDDHTALRTTMRPMLLAVEAYPHIVWRFLVGSFFSGGGSSLLIKMPAP